MAMTIRMWDETIPGGKRPPSNFTMYSALTTPRELIRQRVRQEVERYNQALPRIFRGLVQPEESKQLHTGFRMSVNRSLDWSIQFQQACASFQQNGFLMLVDGEQVTELDEPIALRGDSEVQFVKLVPLVGG